MNIKKIIILLLFLISLIFLPHFKFVIAANSPQVSISGNTLFLKIKESLQYFFTFGTDKKITLLDQQAQNRLNIAQDYADNQDQPGVQNSLQTYLKTKQKQNNLLENADDSNVLGAVQERTVEQQKTMEEIKTKVDLEVKNEIIQVQEQVVNQVAERVVDVNGPEGRDEFFQKVEHVWAPGTGPGGEAGRQYAPGTNEGGQAGTTYAPGTSAGGSNGVIIEGGSIKFAPGTSAGGESGVKYEGGAGQQYAPGTSSGGNSGSDINNVEVVGN